MQSIAYNGPLSLHKVQSKKMMTSAICLQEYVENAKIINVAGIYMRHQADTLFLPTIFTMLYEVYRI